MGYGSIGEQQDFFRENDTQNAKAIGINIPQTQPKTIPQ